MVVKVGDKEYETIEEWFAAMEEKSRNRPWYQKKYDSFKWKVARSRVFWRHKVPQGVHNIIKWAPVIWQDRDWDYTYIYHILAYKFNEMSKLHENYGIAENSKLYSEQLKYASELAQKLADDEWLYDFDEKHQEKTDEFWSYINKNIGGWWD